LEEITLPTLHAGQVTAFEARSRFFALRCGRRFGKTALLSAIACDAALHGQFVGIFAPDYRILSETYNEIVDTLSIAIKQSSKMEGVIRLKTGGRLDFWTLNNPRAGRSRKYHITMLDEVAFAGGDMDSIWTKSIKPTLLDFGGCCIAASTPNGANTENFFWKICNLPELGFTEFHAPTASNPFLDRTEIAKLETDNSPMVYQQEYLAEFVDWSGSAFFNLQSLLDNGEAVEPTQHCDAVFVTLDTATKTGSQHDGTAVVYWAVSKHSGHKLVILDYDKVQIEGALLETWLPNVYRNLEAYAVELKARSGSIGAFIEDKASGTILLQQAIRRGWSAHAIDSRLTAAGKSERAISVSGYVYRGLVKLSKHAYNKVITFKGQSRNHLISEVCGFRIGIDNGADDLTDAFSYGIAIALGDSAGY